MHAYSTYIITLLNNLNCSIRLYSGYLLFHPTDPQGVVKGNVPIFSSQLDIFRRSGAKCCLNHIFCAPPRAYTAQLLTLSQHRANNQYRTGNQIRPTLKASSRFQTAIFHPNTDRCQCCLTSLIVEELVFSEVKEFELWIFWIPKNSFYLDKICKIHFLYIRQD